MKTKKPKMLMSFKNMFCKKPANPKVCFEFENLKFEDQI